MSLLVQISIHGLVTSVGNEIYQGEEETESKFWTSKMISEFSSPMKILKFWFHSDP
jgi:hypothetical protein